MAGAGVDLGAQQSLEHREVALDLPTLAVKLFGKVFKDGASVEAVGHVVGAVGRPAADRGDDPDHAQLLEQEGVVMLTVVAGIAQQRLEAVTPPRPLGHAMELDVVRPGPAIDDSRQQDVAVHLADGRKLGITVIFPPCAAAVVGRSVVAVVAGGIDGGRLAVVVDQAALTGLVNGGVQERIGAPFFRSRFSASCSVR